MKKRALLSAIVAIVTVATIYTIHICKDGVCSATTSTREASSESSGEKPQAKYIFYFIGDGMSASQINLAEAAIKPKSATIGVGELNIRTLPVVGMVTTYAANRYITDSAAAATALATGNKTNVDFISVSPKDGTTPLPTIAERAKEAGMKVGIVTSVSIDHATPAGFYAHTGYRDNYKAIASHLLESRFDYFGGGSPRWNKHSAPSNGEARDIFVDRAEAAGYNFVATRSEFESLTESSTPVIATLNMLGGAEEPYADDSFALPYLIDLDSYSKEDQITLADFTQKGAEILMNDKGFFMMIESGKIDWACHSNDAVTAAYEVIALDNAIAKAIEFYDQHPDETLIVVTGDHETGGLTLGFAGTSYESSFRLLDKQKISYARFKSSYRELIKYSCTPSQSFYDVERDPRFNETFDIAMEYVTEQLGLVDTIDDDGTFSKSYAKLSTERDNIIGSVEIMTEAATHELSNYEVGLLKEALFQSLSGRRFNRFSADDIYTYLMDFAGYDPFATTCLAILNNKAGLDFATFAHTAVPIPVFAMGAGADRFTGYYDNTDIPKIISELAGLKL